MVKSLDNRVLRLLFVFVSVSVLFSSITVLAYPTTVSAEVKGKQNQQDRTMLYALQSCLKRMQLGALSGSDVNTTTLSPLILSLENDKYGGSDKGDPNVPVGYEVGSSDGNIKCADVSLTRAMRFIDKTPSWFLGHIYDLKNPVTSDNGVLIFGLKIHKEDAKKVFDDKVAPLAKRKGADPNKLGSGAGIGQSERERRLAVAFYQCAEPVTDGRATKTNVKVGDTTYQLRESRNGNTKISVGKDWVADGKIQCNTLMNWGDKNELRRALSNEDNRKNAEEAANLSGAAGINPDDIECDGGLGWILCPITELVEKGISEMDNWINNMLTISTGRIFCTQASTDCSGEEVESGQNFYAAWKSFRNIALGIIVIASLIIIISTALGFEFLDAYTIRKVLPRVLLSIIFITLSWSVLEFLVILSNDVGNGIRALIYAPFSNMDSGAIVSANFGINALLGGSLIAYAVAGPGLMALLTFVFTAFLAIIIAFLVMMLRELIVILLILLAPIGIACLILPNTQKGWQLWQNTLWVMLIAFTIISAMIATGRVFAITITNTNDDTLIYKLMALAAYILPYFMLPFAFRLAGGMIGTLAGLANDRSRGAFDRLKNYRNRKAGENWDKTKNFSRYPDKGPLKGVNTAMGALANPTSMLRGRKGVMTTRSSRQKAYGAQFLKDNEIFQANQGDDAFLLALASRKHAVKRRNVALQRSRDSSLSEDDRHAARMEAENYTNALNAAAQLGFRGQTNAVRSQALTALTKTGYQFASGQEGYDELSEIVQDIAGSPEGIHAGAYSQLMDEAQYHLKGAGRSEFAGINHGAKLNIKSGIRKLQNYERGKSKPATYEGGAEAWLGVNSNKKSVSEIAEGINNAVVNNATSTKDILEWQRMLIDDFGPATDANKLEIQKQLDAIASADIQGAVPEEEYNLFDKQRQQITQIHQARLQGIRPIDPNEIENN